MGKESSLNHPFFSHRFDLLRRIPELLQHLFGMLSLKRRKESQLAKVALTFSQPEYSALAVTALTLIASLGARGMKKAAISGAFGLLAATVGIDPMTSDPRFTFGRKSLIGGIKKLI